MKLATIWNFAAGNLIMTLYAGRPGEKCDCMEICRVAYGVVKAPELEALCTKNI